MARILKQDGYELDFDALYTRLWNLAAEDDSGARVYLSHGEEALKWVIAELSGTPAESGRTKAANSDLRKQVHRIFTEEGWADRLGERRFRLLVQPESHRDGSTDEAPLSQKLVPLDDPDDDGAVVESVDADALDQPEGGTTLADLEWSPWVALDVAARKATTTPGVYVARVEGHLVYVGMAGERRGQGVRGRLTIYARGRGAVSGLGEAVLDRALADEAWVAEQLDRLRSGSPSRAKEWAVAAFRRRPLEVCWAAAPTADDARVLERQILVELADFELWNRARPKPKRRTDDSGHRGTGH